jgi:hypothetical protein
VEMGWFTMRCRSSTYKAYSEIAHGRRSGSLTLHVCQPAGRGVVRPAAAVTDQNPMIRSRTNKTSKITERTDTNLARRRECKSIRQINPTRKRTSPMIHP